MKTEQIRLIQDTYTVPAEVGGYLMTCPGMRRAHQFI